MWLTALAATLAFQAGPKSELDVTYAKVGEVELKIDLFRPAEDSKTRRPFVLLVHGGAWMGGNRTEMHGLGRMIAQQGMVAGSVQYRLAPKNKWPSMIDDVQTAVRWVRANSRKLGIDPKRIGAAGASAGGHLALLLGFTDTRDPKPSLFAQESSRVGAVFNIFGPVDFNRDFGPIFEPVFQAVMGKPRKEAVDDVRNASPVTHIDAKDAPVFTLHGDKDPLVSVNQARWLDENLAKAGVKRETVIIPEMRHEIPMDRKEVADAVRRGIQFLKENLEK